MKRFVIGLTLLAGSFSLFGASAATAAPAPIKIPATFESPQQAATYLIMLFEDYATEIDPTSASDRALVEKMLTTHKKDFDVKCSSFNGRIHIASLMAVLYDPEFNKALEEQKIAAICGCFCYRKVSIRADLGSYMKGLPTPPKKLPTAMEDGEDASDKEETSTDSSHSEIADNDDRRDDF